MNATGPQAMPAGLPRLDGARILLAEDNDNNREVALDFMAAARMQVDIAMNGIDALRMAREGDYDLVLMDIQMPGMDGLTATREIRAIARLRTLPIVAMTAQAMTSDRALSRLAGMNDHVTKPVDPDLLFCTLLKWIDPARLIGRTIPHQTPHARPQSGASSLPAPALPALRGIDWRLALLGVDGQRSRLEKRIDSFLREYGSAPRILRQALDGGDHARLRLLAHDLKSSAAYVGAVELCGAANRLEQDLRAGIHDRAMRQVPALLAAAEAALAGLAQVAAPAPQPASRQVRAPQVARLAARLETYLRGDDARAEDALRELEGMLAGSALAGALAPIRRAVDDIEYESALAPVAALAALAALAARLEPSLEDA